MSAPHDPPSRPRRCPPSRSVNDHARVIPLESSRRLEQKAPARASEGMDALGVLTFMRSLLWQPSAASEHEQRALLLLLVEMALSDLTPEPVPSWYWAWQLLSPELQAQVQDVVRHCLEQEHHAARPH